MFSGFDGTAEAVPSRESEFFRSLRSRALPVASQKQALEFFGGAELHRKFRILIVAVQRIAA